jgi:Cys-tRNA(Pro)/Cys-tRNA(Cys) deacylase
MARTPEEILQAAGVLFRSHEHVPVATVAEIVDALPFPAEEHVKTLAFEAGDLVVLAALRGSDRVGFGPLARALGLPRDRIRALLPERVRAELGFEPGGVCPLVDRDGVTVLVDRRVLGLDRAFCGSGRNDVTLELSPADLVTAARATVADLAGPPVSPTPRG